MSIKVTGGDKLIVKLNRLQTMDLRPEFIQLGDFLRRYYSGEAFLSRGQVFGQRWQPIKNSASKSRKYIGQPLERTGKMRNSFVASVGKNQVTITNSAPYFKYHQSSAPRRVLPRRIMLGVNNPITAKTLELLNNGIRRLENE